MPKLNHLIAKLHQDYPELRFQLNQRDFFRPPSTIFYTDHTYPLVLLHELGHFLSHHVNFSSDIELLQAESTAWAVAKRLCSSYQINWDEDFAQDHLDSYRDYLHSASLCPNCQLNGYQDNSGNYHCPFCTTTWPSPGRPDY